jgi:hypothetical protein
MSDAASNAAYRRFLNDTHAQLQHQVEAREREVTTTRSFVTGLVPGLLQVPDYAAGVFEQMAALMDFGPQGTGPEAVAARMNRQRVLDDEGKQFDYLIPEAALYVPMCAPEAMRAQFERLIATLKRPNIRLGIIPLHAQVELVPFHGFTICDDELVQIEMFTGQLTLTSDDDVRLHKAAFERLACSAVYDDQARALLQALRDRIR